MRNDNYIPIGEENEQYHGRILRIFTQNTQLNNGKTIAFEYAERSPGVRIMVFADDSVLLTKEWRLEQQKIDIRLPGGKVFDSLNEYLRSKSLSQEEILEKARIAAQKELQEETGLEIPLKSFNYICTSSCGATVIWDLIFFSVTLPKIQELPKMISSDEGEKIEPDWHTISEVLKYFTAGAIGEDRASSVLVKEILKNKLLGFQI